ncbi:MAG: universal stress protein, partial [Bacteroidota bacterium]
PEYPIDEKVSDKINLDLTEVFGEQPPFATKVEVREGQPLAKLLHWVDIKEIDCVVVGRKQQSEGSGITARRVAREAKSNILFVPDAPLRYVRKILVPIDFSENSARAVQQAYAWKLRNPDIQIQGLYLIDLPPTDYYLRPVPRSGFQDILKSSAESAFKKFVKRNNLADVPIDMVYIDNMYSNVAHHIDEFAKKNGADMIVVGAQGHNRLNRFVFGSVTERLAERNHEIPLMIIR